MGLDKDERENFMKEIGLNRTGLNKLIREGYDLLNLDTYFTSGPEESRADPVFKWYLSDLKINLSNKSYSRDNRLN